MEKRFSYLSTDNHKWTNDTDKTQHSIVISKEWYVQDIPENIKKGKSPEGKWCDLNTVEMWGEGVSVRTSIDTH
jgi:hypothetical protein